MTFAGLLDLPPLRLLPDPHKVKMPPLQHHRGSLSSIFNDLPGSHLDMEQRILLLYSATSATKHRKSHSLYFLFYRQGIGHLTYVK